MSQTRAVKEYQARELRSFNWNWLRKLLYSESSSRFKISLFLITSVVIVSVISASSYITLRNLILDQIKERVFLQVSAASDQINEWVEVHSLAIKLSANTNAVRTMKWQKVLPIFKFVKGRFNEFVIFFLGFPNGSNYNTVEGKTHYSIKDRRYFQKAIAGQFNISNPIIGRTTKVPIITIASPIHRTYDLNSSTIGHIHGSLPITKIVQVTNEVHYGKNSYAFLLNSDGEAIVHPNPRFVLSKKWQAPNLLKSHDPGLAQLARKMVSKHQGFELFHLDGEQKYVAYLPLKNVDWSIALVIPRTYIESQLNLINILTIVLALLLLTLAIIFCRQIYLSEAAKKQVVLLDKQRTILQQQADELAQTLQELKKTQIQLVQKEKMSSLGQLVAGLAHEVNNPLSFIYSNIGYADQYFQDLFEFIETYQYLYTHPQPRNQNELDLTELDFLEADFPKLLCSMRVGADRIRQISLSLREFSRLDETILEAIDIHESIDSTLLVLQSRLNNPHKHQIIQVIKEYGDIPPVECYPSQINQVFLHILSNAIDAVEGLFTGTNSEQDTKQFTITQPLLRVRTELTPEKTVNIAIANNGPSIPKDIQEIIFNPFFTTKSIGQGTGLGLSISYQFVTKVHKGNLILVSTPEQLTEFIIQIPLLHRK